jgi:oxygen-independent coproporphyrinogen-3 oxidase
LYLKGIESENLVSEIEELTIENRINEYIMTSLRTIWGLDIKWFEKEFGPLFTQTIETSLKQKIHEGLIEQNGTIL